MPVENLEQYEVFVFHLAFCGELLLLAADIHVFYLMFKFLGHSIYLYPIFHKTKFIMRYNKLLNVCDI